MKTVIFGIATIVLISAVATMSIEPIDGLSRNDTDKPPIPYQFKDRCDKVDLVLSRMEDGGLTGDDAYKSLSEESEECEIMKVVYSWE